MGLLPLVHSYLITSVPHAECSLDFHLARMITAFKTQGEFEQLVILLSVCSRRLPFLLRCTPHISTSPGISYQSLQTPERLSLSLRKVERGRCCITAFRLKKELKRQLRRPCAICVRSISAEFCWLLRLYSAVGEESDSLYNPLHYQTHRSVLVLGFCSYLPAV